MVFGFGGGFESKELGAFRASELGIGGRAAHRIGALERGAIGGRAVEKALEGLDLGVLSSLLARVREAFTKMCEANIRASSQRFREETRAEFEDLFAALAAVGHGGMSWCEDEDKKKKSGKKMETGKPHARKRRLTTAREGDDHVAKRHRKDDGAGDGSGGSGGSEGGIATI